MSKYVPTFARVSGHTIRLPNKDETRGPNLALPLAFIAAANQAQGNLGVWLNRAIKQASRRRLV